MSCQCITRIKNFRISCTLGLFAYISKLSALLLPQPKVQEIMKFIILVLDKMFYGESAFTIPAGLGGEEPVVVYVLLLLLSLL